jgi:hypothetical protein
MHKRQLAGLLALLWGLLLVPGCGKDRPAPSPEPSSTKPPVAVDKTPKSNAGKAPVEPPKTDRPAYTVTAIGITEEFAKDRVAAEKKYKDKLIEVEGTVTSVTQNSVRRTADLSLLGSKKPGEALARQVVCEMKKSLVGKVGLLGKGQKVRVKGKLDSESGGNVTLKEVEYEELTPSSVPRVTAQMLAKEFAQDKEAAAKKYGDKEVIVEGTIVDLAEKDRNCSVKLAGSDKLVVTCNVEEDEFKTLKKGEKVRLKGELSLFVSGEVVIVAAYLVNS